MIEFFLDWILTPLLLVFGGIPLCFWFFNPWK